MAISLGSISKSNLSIDGSTASLFIISLHSSFKAHGSASMIASRLSAPGMGRPGRYTHANNLWFIQEPQPDVEFMRSFCRRLSAPCQNLLYIADLHCTRNP